MRYLALAGAIAITGCSVDNSDSDGTIYTYTEEQTDATGIVLEPGGDMHVNFETVSALYQDTMSCMGMTAPPPTVAFIDFMQRYGVIGGWGVYIPAGPNLVWINTRIEEVIPRNYASDSETLKHEYVHHILYENGLEWQGHGNPLWEKCGFGLVVVDGVPQSM